MIAHHCFDGASSNAMEEMKQLPARFSSIPPNPLSATGDAWARRCRARENVELPIYPFLFTTAPAQSRVNYGQLPSREVAPIIFDDLEAALFLWIVD
jgi:hypothetical protein